MAELTISYEELRERIVNRYNVEELCELLELTPEDIFDQAFDQTQHLDRFGDVLTELDFNVDG